MFSTEMPTLLYPGLPRPMTNAVDAETDGSHRTIKLYVNTGRSTETDRQTDRMTDRTTDRQDDRQDNRQPG